MVHWKYKMGHKNWDVPKNWDIPINWDKKNGTFGVGILQVYPNYALFKKLSMWIIPRRSGIIHMESFLKRA